MKNNKGFSLIELVIAISIASVVSLCVLVFMNSSTKLYAASIKDVTIRYRAQIINAQLEKILSECNEISVNDSYISIKNEIENKVYSFQYDAANKTVYMQTFNYSGNKKDYAPSFVPANLFCHDIESFSLTPENVELNDVIKYVKIHFTISISDFAYNFDQTVHCMNLPIKTQYS